METGRFPNIFEVFGIGTDGVDSVWQFFRVKIALGLAVNGKKDHVANNFAVFGDQFDENIPEIGIQLVRDPVNLVNFHPDFIAGCIKITIDLDIKFLEKDGLLGIDPTLDILSRKVYGKEEQYKVQNG